MNAEGRSDLESAPSGGGNVLLARGLSVRLLILTVLFVMAAEVLIFLPSIAGFKLEWLEERLAMAAAASQVLLASTGDAELSPALRQEMLLTIGAKAVAIGEEGESRLLVVTDVPIAVDEHVDLNASRPFPAMGHALSTLFAGGDRIIRAYGHIGSSDKLFEIIIDDRELRAAMLVYSRNVALISLVISLFTATLVFYALDRLMIRPIRRMTRSMLRFSEAPEDPGRIIRPSRRSDEIGIAERELSAMQGRLQSMLAEQRHLADLGLAVSKINHDMRNLLTPAQLLSDRLSAARDPAVQAVVPKLVRTINRAVSYSEGVMAYGRTQEAPPSRRRLRLRRLVEEVNGLLAIGNEDRITFRNEVPAGFEIEADYDHFFRILTNLCRNSIQAMLSDEGEAIVHELTVTATREKGAARIEVIDTGPGLAPKARENLFAAFRGSARSGGTGLGLAIANELVRAHGGTLELVESRSGRTVFAILLPDDSGAPSARRDTSTSPAFAGNEEIPH